MQTLSISSTMPSSSSSSSSSSLASSSRLCLKVRASWDTQQMVSYNPNAPRKLKKANPPTPPIVLSPSAAKMADSVSNLLKRQNPPPQELEKENGTYLGYDVWLPNPPKVEKPRFTFNAAALAYLGDCIYELYARRHFLYPPSNVEEYNDRVTAVVRCEAQDALLHKLISENFLTQQERDLLRWGKNVGSSKTRTKKRAGTAVYNRASSLETLIGYLYLTNAKRLEEVMIQIGFSTDSSMPFTLDEVNGKSLLLDKGKPARVRGDANSETFMRQ